MGRGGFDVWGGGDGGVWKIVLNTRFNRVIHQHFVYRLLYLLPILQFLYP
jgi:hypothetical protein